MLDELRKSGEVTDFDLESQVGGGEMMAVEGDGKPGRVDAGVEVTDQSDVMLVEGEDVCDMIEYILLREQEQGYRTEPCTYPY